MEWNDTGSLLENSNLMDWHTVYENCMATWQNTPDARSAANLIFVCWYPQTEMMLLSRLHTIQDELHDTLKATAHAAVSEYSDHQTFALIVGHCIAFTPAYFGEAKEWGAIGKSLLEGAHKREPDDPIARYLYRTWVDHSGPRPSELDAAAVRAAKQRFGGTDILSRYFRDLISGA